MAKITRDEYGSPAQWFAICKEVRVRDQYRCVKCKEREDSKNGVYHDVHHIRSLRRGGLTVLANLILLCKNCHSGRHNHLHKAGYGSTSLKRKRTE